jgi:hypothetical protein
LHTHPYADIASWQLPRQRLLWGLRSVCLCMLFPNLTRWFSICDLWMNALYLHGVRATYVSTMSLARRRQLPTMCPLLGSAECVLTNSFLEFVIRRLLQRLLSEIVVRPTRMLLMNPVANFPQFSMKHGLDAFQNQCFLIAIVEYEHTRVQ